MPTDYITQIGQVDSAQLIKLLESLRRTDRAPEWAGRKLFEHVILRAFELEGAEIAWPFSVPMAGEVVEQIDGAVYYGGLACLVESKRLR